MAPTLHTEENELAELAEFLIDTAKAGYGKSRKQVQMTATNMVRLSPSRRTHIKWLVLPVYGKAKSSDIA